MDSLIAATVWFITSITSAATSGLVGARADSVMRYLARSVIERMRQGKERTNHELQRALRKASLEATLFACNSRLRQFGVSNKRMFDLDRVPLRVATNPEVQWLLETRSAIQRELNEIHRAQYQPPTTKAEEQIEILLQENHRAGTDQRDRLRVLMHEEVIREYSHNQHDPPQAFAEMIRHGWTYTQKNGATSTVTWFERFNGCFLYEFKTNQHLSTIVKGEILASLKVDGVSTSSLEVDVEQQWHTWSGTMFERLDTLNAQLAQLIDTQEDQALFLREQMGSLAIQFDGLGESLADTKQEILDALAELHRQRETPYAASGSWKRDDLEALRVLLTEAALPAEEYLDIETLLERYLNWLIEQYAELELPGLPQGGRRPAVELDTVYVALRGDFSNPYERVQGQAILEREARQLENLTADEELTPQQQLRMVFRLISLIARAPLPISIEERDRPHLFQKDNQHTITLGEAFRRERRLVILGDPGSGKTTLARWLTLKLAQAKLNGEDDVRVPAHHVDPALSGTDEPVNLGPVRVPILIRVATFANDRKATPQRRLAEFIGHHVGTVYGQRVANGRGQVLDPFQLNSLFVQLLEAGQAVVLLDGLDEINDPADRYDIVREIDRFIEAYLPEESDFRLSVSEQEVRMVKGVGAPFEDGGNQVIVTSRIVGYQMAPLSNKATHLTIEPMGQQAIDRFCDVWMHAIHRVSMASRHWDARAEAEARREAQGLKEAIADLRRRHAGELASNPLLVTILALVFRDGLKRTGEASFPKQRVKLYETAVSILIEKWQERAQMKGEKPFEEHKVLHMLELLAAYIHENSSMGVVDEKNLQRFLAAHLDDDEVAALHQVIREEVGLLTARGEGVYGFLHLTFQEYLTACSMLADPERIAEEILEKLSAPRWREPILMALGQLSAGLEEAPMADLLFKILQAEDPLGKIVPRAVLLIVAALPEMVCVPESVIEESTEQLLMVYSHRPNQERFPSLCQLIEQAFSQLFASEHAPVVERVLVKTLRVEDLHPVLAIAQLLRVTRHYTAPLAEALAAFVMHDEATWGWPIDRVLRDIALRNPTLLPDTRGSLRRTLQREPELAERFLQNAAWIRIGIAVYGGLNTNIPEEQARIKAEIARIDQEQQQWNTKTRDPAHETETARLRIERAEWDAKLKGLKGDGYKFALEYIHRDSPLTPLIIKVLEEAQPPQSLIPQFWDLFKNAEDSRLDALMALAVLGEPIASILESAHPAGRQVIAQLDRLDESLQAAVPSVFSPTIAALKKMGNACPEEDLADLVAATVDVALAFGGEPINCIEILETCSGAVKPVMLAESWNAYLSSENDDPFYNIMVVLDTLGSQLADPPWLLAQSLALVARRANPSAIRHVAWPGGKLAPRARNPLDVLTRALDALNAIPEPFSIVRGWALTRLASLIKQHGLLVEACMQAVCTLSDRFNERTEALQALVGEQHLLFNLIYHPYPALEFLQAAHAIDDAYLRFRTYWRLLSYFPDLRRELLLKPDRAEARPQDEPKKGLWGWISSLFVSDDEAFLVRAVATAQTIDDPARKAWAFEQLVRFGAESQRVPWLEHARKTALQIADPDNRCRALARLATYYPIDDAEKLLKKALLTAARIRNERQRAETLADLRDRLSGYPRLPLLFDNTVKRLKDERNRERVHGSRLSVLYSYEKELVEADSNVAVLLLGALVKELRRPFTLPSRLAGLWATMATERRPKAMQALLERARSDGLRLTSEAALALDDLIKSNQLDSVHQLVPFVQYPTSTVLPLINGWLRHADTAIRQHANLLLAEAKEISEQVIPVLVELLKQPEDRTRYRAALALHGDVSGHVRDLLPVSNLGSSTLEMLAGQRRKHTKLEPQVTLVLGWTFHRIKHNDGRALVAWAEQLASETAAAKNAKIILRSIDVLDTNTWPTFLQLLEKNVPAVQETLLESLARMTAIGRVPEQQWEALPPILRSLDGDAIWPSGFVLDGPSALVKAAEEALIQASSQTRQQFLAEAERCFDKERVSLSDILQQDVAAMRRFFSAVGDLKTVNNRFHERIMRAAEYVQDKPPVLEGLIDWLDERLKDDVQDTEQFQWKTSDLLSVVAAAAERLPNTFYNKAISLPLFEQKLREAITFCNSFPGRQAALVLLSYLRRITPNVTAALRTALRDVVEVQVVVLQSVTRYRELESDFLPQLIEDLRDPSPVVGYATAQMLAAVARNIHLSPDVRNAIIEAFAETIEHPGSQRDVYLLITEGGPLQATSYAIKHMGRLDEILYRLLVELSGISDIGPRRIPVTIDEA